MKFLDEYTLLIFFVLLFYFSCENRVDSRKLETNLEKDGFLVWNINPPNDLTPVEKREFVKKEVMVKLPKDYIFLDYIYYIKGCSLSTFHRDVTSSQSTFNTKYPTYTAVLYEYDGDFVSICPNSHKTYPFTFSQPLSISGKKNTLVLFNCEMLHAGMINKIGVDRKVIQFKIVHKDDYDKLAHLNKVHVDKIGNCNLDPNYEAILRKLSFYFSFIINTVFRQALIRKEDGGVVSGLQNIVPISFYNNIKN